MDESGLLGHGRVNGEDNVHAAYAAHLCMENAAHRGYQPNFVLKNSKAIQQAHRRRWQETCVKIQTGWLEKDLQHLREAADSSDHFVYMLSDGRRKNEVSVRTLTSEELRKMNQAKKLEADQWISNTVFSVAKRAGIPKTELCQCAGS